MRAIALFAALGIAAPAVAQTAPAAPVASPAVDPARLAAAQRLFDVIMPPATRQQMMQAMLQPLLGNISKGMTSNPQFAQAMSADPKVAAAFDRFMAQQQARTIEMIQTSLPQMVQAMSRAYARRFDVAQLGELERFFRTPTGAAYLRESMTIMSDPDVAAWQRTMMTDSMNRVQQDAMAFAKEVAAIKQGETK